MRRILRTLKSHVAILPVVTILVSTTHSVGGPFEDAEAAFQARDYATAMTIWQPLATKGSIRAQSLMALLYDTGLGVQRDPLEAARWYRKAADQGHIQSQLQLGFKYSKGDGVSQSDFEAATWFRRASEQGDPGAQGLLGSLYRMGKGVAQDYVLAHMWLNLAATASVPVAPSEDPVRGILKGFADASKKLTVEERDELTRLMTPQQLAEAQALARAWKPRPEREPQHRSPP
jgi:uncharacterized protein